MTHFCSHPQVAVQGSAAFSIYVLALFYSQGGRLLNTPLEGATKVLQKKVPEQRCC